MEASELIKGNVYAFGAKKGFRILVIYLHETLNYRRFEDNLKTMILITDSAVENNIFEKDNL